MATAVPARICTALARGSLCAAGTRRRVVVLLRDVAGTVRFSRRDLRACASLSRVSREAPGARGRSAVVCPAHRPSPHARMSVAVRPTGPRAGEYFSR